MTINTTELLKNIVTEIIGELNLKNLHFALDSEWGLLLGAGAGADQFFNNIHYIHYYKPECKVFKTGHYNVPKDWSDNPPVNQCEKNCHHSDIIALCLIGSTIHTRVTQVHTTINKERTINLADPGSILMLRDIIRNVDPENCDV